MKLVEHMWPELIEPELGGQDKQQIISELARHLARTQFDLNADLLTQALLAREALASTAVGEGVAFPHCKFEAAPRLFICLGRSRQGVDFGAFDKLPTHLFFLLVAPESMASLHLKALSRISRICRDAGFRARLLEAHSGVEMFRILEEGDADG